MSKLLMVPFTLTLSALALIAGSLAGCGASAPGAATAPVGPPEAEGLDWALLLPLETDALVQVDLRRARRSPHRESLLPVLEEMIGSATHPSMRASLGSMIERTDVVLIALIPSPEPDTEEEALVLARGRYTHDELQRLDARAEPGQTRALEVDGHPVWTETEGDTAVAQPRLDTVVMTGSLERMERLIARMRMARDTPRWPPALRELVEATGLERATLGVAMANRNVAPEHGEPMAMSMAGTADADGPLDLEVLVELGDPTLASAAAVFFGAMVAELGQAATGEAFALRQLAQLAQIEARGTRVRGSIHAEPTAAEQLVPGLLGLLRDGMSGDAVPPLGGELPTPI